jgi:hypothetical protein
MKKLISVVAAGALLLSVAGVVLAKGSKVSTTNQSNSGTLTVVGSVAVSNSGLNQQNKGGFQTLTTGGAYSSSSVLSVANQNGKGTGSGNLNQSNYKTATVVLSVAGSNSGLNQQNGASGFSVQTLHTGRTGSDSSVASWANINLDGVSLE